MVEHRRQSKALFLALKDKALSINGLEMNNADNGLLWRGNSVGLGGGCSIQLSHGATLCLLAVDWATSQGLGHLWLRAVTFN